MDEYIRLVSVLDDLISCHRALLGIEQEKQQLIISQDWNLLQEHVERSRKLLEKIEVGENARLDLVEKLGLERESTLSDIVHSAPRQAHHTLASRGEQLRELIYQLKALNRQSERLLQSSLEVVNFTLSLLAGSEQQGKTYGGNGEERKAEGKQTSLMFDLKV